MGIRNAFRVFADPKTGWIIWGDVGGNVDPNLGLGPEGYDEINVARGPGFFGWPFLSGPNAPWRPFDPATKKWTTKNTGNATLSYGTGNQTDVSAKLGTIAAGTTFTVDTNGNVVTYASAITSAAFDPGACFRMIDAAGWPFTSE